MILNFTLPVCFYSKHSVNTRTHHVFHIGDSNDCNDNVTVDIPVPSVPKKQRVMKEGHIMKLAITHRGKEIAGDPFISEPATDHDANLETPNIVAQMKVRMRKQWRVKQRVKLNLITPKVLVPNAIVQELSKHC